MNHKGNMIISGFSQLSFATKGATQALKQFGDAWRKVNRFQRIKLLVWEYKTRLFWLYRQITRKIRLGK